MPPIIDFIKAYSQSGVSRFHMPGHKGSPLHGLEPLDITEIKGADYLYSPTGIIARSEALTSQAFGSAATLYSTEGSSLCIKAMLAVVMRSRKAPSRPLRVAAPRNVHKAFLDACILLDIDPVWLYPEDKVSSLCTGRITPSQAEKALAESSPDALYITSPDYAGNIADIRALAAAAHKYGIPLICDNAHGAYLRFLPESLHPLDLGADLCCDSAHKTLPCYTGGAYLHVSKSAPPAFLDSARRMMSLFGSTSPSYLIMQSLDLCAGYISSDYPSQLSACVRRTAECKERLKSCGLSVTGDEPCKIVINAAKSGMTGDELAETLRRSSIEPEYSDKALTVLMTTPFNSERDYERLEKAVQGISSGAGEREEEGYELPRCPKRMRIREAAFSASERIKTESAAGRVCAMTAVSCQPSIPVVMSGEEITPAAAKLLSEYGIEEIEVVR